MSRTKVRLSKTHKWKDLCFKKFDCATHILQTKKTSFMIYKGQIMSKNYLSEICQGQKGMSVLSLTKYCQGQRHFSVTKKDGLFSSPSPKETDFGNKIKDRSFYVLSRRKVELSACVLCQRCVLTSDMSWHEMFRTLGTKRAELRVTDNYRYLQLE